MSSGIVFSVKEFTLHDGPGIRTTVFLKGCPLRCAWCHNPEGLSQSPELMVKTSLCTGCGKCLLPCTHTECAPFGRCTKVCQHGLIEICGEQVDAHSLAEKLKRNAAFFTDGGGITLSGGEPLMQGEFTLALLRELRPLHRAVETSGYANQATFRAIAKESDLMLMDIKLVDDAQHIRWTGASNRLILCNLEQLKSIGIPFVIRVPLIPGISDTEYNMRSTADLLSDCVDRVQVELLPYNELAGAKYASVGLSYEPSFDATAALNNHMEMFRSRHIPVRVLQ